MPTHWSDRENVAWKQDLPGLGWSSPVLVGGKLYLTTAAPIVESLQNDLSLDALCLDAASGKLLWQRQLFRQEAASAPKIHTKNSHASPSPLIAGGKLFVHFGHQGTACLDLAGEVLWRSREVEYDPVHGNGGSPVLVGNRLIFTCDGSANPGVAALDAGNGKLVWRTERPVKPVKQFSFCTPLAIEVAGKTQVVCPGAGAIVAYDPASGEELWQVRYDGYSVVPRPVFGQGLVIFSTGYDSPSVFAVRPDGQGNVTETHVAWTLKRGAPLSPSPLVVGEELYLVSDGGVASCVAAKTGEIVWQERVGGRFSASPVHADGKLYLLSEDGVGTVLAASREYKLLATNRVPERTLASFAVDDRCLFLRTDKRLYRIESPAK